jgi:hypothetical protein
MIPLACTQLVEHNPHRSNSQYTHNRADCVVCCRPEWGASSCPPSTPELVLRTDGCIDIRIPTVLAAVLDAAAAAGVNGSNGSSNARLAAVLSDLVRRRCQQLLLQMPTSLQEDQQLQQQQQQRGGSVSDGAGDDGGLMGAVLQYRMAKKKLLHKFAEL